MKINFYRKLGYLLILGGLITSATISRTSIIKLFDKNLTFAQKKEEIKNILPLSLIPACEIYDYKSNQTVMFYGNKLTSSPKNNLVKKIPSSLILACENPKFNKLEMKFKNKGYNLKLNKLDDSLLSNGLKLERYNFTAGLYAGINNIYPGSGYIDKHENNIILLSAKGIIGYSSKDNLKEFKQIKNNINSFIGISTFDKNIQFSLKDISIIKNKIYVSFTEELKNDCFNTSLLKGSFNYDEIIFEKFFTPSNCVDSNGGVDKEFNAHQSGGKIIPYDDNNLLLTIGDYRNRALTQNNDYVNGKIIKINIENPKQYQLFSKGHRNPQGLLLDKKNGFILETEHGPKGGDEINLINFTEKNNEIPNYGWPISSAGEHYRENKEKTKYLKYPLYKSHEKYGFIEPLKSFVPSIGISEIAKVGDNHYVASSLKDLSLYFFKLDNKNKIMNMERVEVFERIRDLLVINNKLFLFMENTPSIGIITIN